MVRSDSPSGEEYTPAEAAPTAASFIDTIMEKMAQQDAVQKAMNEQLIAIAAILAPLTRNPADPALTIRRQLFDTHRTACAGKKKILESAIHMSVPSNDRVKTATQPEPAT
ncbi:unnamed protein product [Brassica rapa]|uniref:Uncharacterized protein n=1 Tax=Brassica campestris TaxID=3711 RepID=A0A8D9I3D7_BRACM|nr:unnamed protein product [Brassica rapa]